MIVQPPPASHHHDDDDQHPDFLPGDRHLVPPFLGHPNPNTSTLTIATPGQSLILKLSTGPRVCSRGCRMCCTSGTETASAVPQTTRPTDERDPYPQTHGTARTLRSTYPVGQGATQRSRPTFPCCRLSDSSNSAGRSALLTSAGCPLERPFRLLCTNGWFSCPSSPARQRTHHAEKVMTLYHRARLRVRESYGPVPVASRLAHHCSSGISG